VRPESLPTNRGFPSVASLTGITDLKDLESRLGVQAKMIPFRALSDAMERTIADPAAGKEAAAAADELIRARSIPIWIATTSLAVFSSEDHRRPDGNPLRERIHDRMFRVLCSRLPEKWKITPCLIHTLFKDRGIASSCEGDLGALLGMRMLMSWPQVVASGEHVFPGRKDPGDQS